MNLTVRYVESKDGPVMEQTFEDASLKVIAQSLFQFENSKGQILFLIAIPLVANISYSYPLVSIIDAVPLKVV